jgi:hypothetical protein
MQSFGFSRRHAKEAPMQTRLTQYAMRSAVRHPRRAIRIGLFTSAVLRSTRKARGRGRYLVVMTEPVKRAATDRRVHRESRRAGADAASAFRRVGQVGVVEAMSDRRVARKLGRATHHASRAVVYSVSPPPQHRKRNAALVALGVGGVTAGVLAKRRAPGSAVATPDVPDAPEVSDYPDLETEIAPEGAADPADSVDTTD